MAFRQTTTQEGFFALPVISQEILYPEKLKSNEKKQRKRRPTITSLLFEASVMELDRTLAIFKFILTASTVGSFHLTDAPLSGKCPWLTVIRHKQPYF